MYILHCKKYLPALALMLLCSTARAQQWTQRTADSTYMLKQLFYQYYKRLIPGPDSFFYILSCHKPANYWERRNRGSETMLLSRVGKATGISLVKQMEFYVEEPFVKIANGNYYILDNQPVKKDRNYYSTCYVYDSLWQYRYRVYIPHLPHQQGYGDFEVDSRENMYFISNPYFIDHKQENFKGSYIIKLSPSGEVKEKLLLEKCYLNRLRLKGSSITLKLLKQRLDYPFYVTDSVINIELDTLLQHRVLSATAYTPPKKKIDQSITLTSGSTVQLIDSSYRPSPALYEQLYKLALNDSSGQRRWTVSIEPRVNAARMQALKNGQFAVLYEQRWDSSKVVLYNEQGMLRTLKSFALKPDTRIERYSIIDFFEMIPGELWLFYKKELPDLQEELYFEKLKLQ